MAPLSCILSILTATSSQSSKKSCARHEFRDYKMKKLILLLAAIPLLLASCNSRYSNEEPPIEDSIIEDELIDENYEYENYSQELTQEERFASIDLVRENIEGTTWVFDKPNFMGYKIVFENGMIYVYSKLPWSDDWGNEPFPVFSNYEIKENYYEDGERFVYIQSGRISNYYPDMENFFLIPANGGCSINNKSFEGIVHLVE